MNANNHTDDVITQEGTHKNNSGLRIIFMGTPEFAVASLDKLVLARYNIVAVVTAADKTAGRGLQMQQSAVKKYAVEKGLMVLQPDKLRDPLFIESLQSLNADVQIVVAFRMLPEIVWNMPPLGTVNLHGSLLPQYRGAAPINWAVINGDKYTGVTTFKLQHQIDTGNILLFERITIGDNETAGELHDRMKDIGADLLLKTITEIEHGILKEIPQQENQDISHELLKHAPKIFTETCNIDWNKSAEDIYNLIRGLSPSPGAFTFIGTKKLKIFNAGKIIKEPAIAAGEYETDGKNYLRFAAINGYLEIVELQLEGKNKMRVQQFLRGYHF